MTNGVYFAGNTFRECRFIAIEPAEGIVIRDNFVKNTIIRDSGDPEVDPSAGEDRAA